MKVKVLRLLEYTGELEDLKEHFRKRGVQGSKNFGCSINIREHFLGDSPIVWDELEVTAKLMLGDAE